MNNPPTIDDYLRMPPHPLRITGGCRADSGRKHTPKLPLVTVLTIVRNRKETLPQTITSVLNQSYPNIEYIIVDGASTDGTLEVLKQFDDKIDLWISEPDQGPSDAINKAISYASGNFISWIHSDDWADHHHVRFAVETLLSSGADFVFGDMSLYKNKKLEFIAKSTKDYAKSITYRAPHLHFPTLVIKRECFQKIGLFDMNYKMANDYEWLLRLHLQGGWGLYDSRLHVCCRMGGISNQYNFQGMLEELKVLRQHELLTAKAIVTNLYYRFVRRSMRYLAELFLPDSLYKKLMRVVRRRYSVPLD